jgi:hypothetical protein
MTRLASPFGGGDLCPTRRYSLLGHWSQNVYRNRTPFEPWPESAVSPWMARS